MEGGRKRNVTLSVDSEVVRKAKSSLVLNGKTMSKVFEEALQNYVSSIWISSLESSLGIKLGKINPRDMPKLRPKAPKGWSSSSVIREMRGSM